MVGRIPFYIKLRVCWHVFQEKSVIYNLHFFGKARIRRPAAGLLSIWCNNFEEYSQGSDNFMVLPDDLPKEQFGRIK